MTWRLIYEHFLANIGAYSQKDGDTPSSGGRSQPKKANTRRECDANVKQANITIEGREPTLRETKAVGSFLIQQRRSTQIRLQDMKLTEE